MAGGRTRDRAQVGGLAVRLDRMMLQLDRVDRNLNVVLRRQAVIMKALAVSIATEEYGIVATQEHIDQLNAKIAANTDAVSAATTALGAYVKTNEDLAAQLKAALAGDDDAAVSAAIAAIDANNTMLKNAVPATAAAIVASTPAAP